MNYALTQTTNSVLEPSPFRKWAFLTMVSRHLRRFLEGGFDAFSSNVATSTSINRIDIENDFWKSPLLQAEVERTLTLEDDTRSHEASEEEASIFYEEVTRLLSASNISELTGQILDWDAHIEIPRAPSRSGTIKISFKCIGRSKPIPIDDPWA